MELYPLTFEPILKDRIWGGTKLKSDLGKNILSDTTGESWELSAVDGDISIIKNGECAGMRLTDLLKDYPEPILGKKIYERYGTAFPLLFKFLDARADLSIQVHPNDELAKKRHNSFGKTEMWYVMQADEGAKIIVGFKDKSSPDEYVKHLEDKNLIEILNEVEVKKGDVFFLETGTIHAIGAGTVIAEIQQTSDITYRVYDWDRVDSNGNRRELHTEQALDAINYNTTNAKKEYTNIPNTANVMVDCPYFTTSYFPLMGDAVVEKNGSSFTVYICTEGVYDLFINGKNYSYTKGDTVLIPAVFKKFELAGKATLLEIYIA